MHSAYEEMQYSSPLLECRLRTVASFQNVQYGTDLTNTTSASNQLNTQWSAMLIVYTLTWCDENANSYFFNLSSQKHIFQYNHKKNNRPILIEGHSTKYLTSALKTCYQKNK